MDYYSNNNINQIQNNYNASYYEGNYYNNYVPSSFQTLDPRLKFYNQQYDLNLKESNIQNKNDDELWVETWLSKVGKIDINLDSTVVIKKVDSVPKKQSNNNKNLIKINVAKNSLAKCLQIINRLQETQDYLKTNVASMSSVEWKKHTVEIGSLKDELLAVMAQFENNDTMRQLKSVVSKRKKKRLNQKKRRVDVRENLLAEKQEQNRINEEIDLWLENMKDSVERVKMVR